ncbi:MAG: hypothetical protein ACXACF_06295 [Candidatus Hermodarchaeia archaeon]
MPLSARRPKNIHQFTCERALDPHRFEDLVRNLIYDFRRWQSIEATGKGGSDEGFDIRAWEGTQEVVNIEDEEGEQGIHPMEGNLWKIQCKREKKLGPSRVKKIIDEGVEKDSPPYGYILVAPTNFSKQSYDVFRNGLREKGVMEFYLWGKAELEDMLYLPKNDHILFAFFGISLVTRKRLRFSEIKFAINNKNKLLRILSGGSHIRDLHESILVRDYKDIHYPWRGEYKDFDKRPRWMEHIVIGYHPLGLIVKAKEHFAFADLDKKEWDYTKAVDLVHRQGEQKYGKVIIDETRRRVEDFYKYLPRRNQAKFMIEGIIFFEDILVIDDKGDISNSYPHIFVDFKPSKGPFRGFWYYLEIDGQKIELDDNEFKRVKVFPQKFPEIKKGKVYKRKTIQWDSETLRLFKVSTDRISVLFDVDGKYDFLNVRDVILVSDKEEHKEKVFIKVTYKYSTTVKKYLKDNKYLLRESKESIERQVGRKVKDNESMTVFEIEKVYEWQIKD